MDRILGILTIKIEISINNINPIKCKANFNKEISQILSMVKEKSMMYESKITILKWYIFNLIILVIYKFILAKYNEI